MTTPPRRPATSAGWRVAAAAGLVLDAWVHVDLAPAYRTAGPGVAAQCLFLVEAGAALAAALLVLTRRGRVASLLAAAVAASALAAVVAYRYVDLGALGPLPDLYEPVWYPEKALAAVAEAAALVAALTAAAWPGPAPSPAPAARPSAPPPRPG